MITGSVTALPQVLRVRVRVKKWHVHPSGGELFWRAVSSISAIVSTVLAAVFLYLLLRLLFTEEFSHMASQWTPTSLQWLWSERAQEMHFAAAPEPSRCVLLLGALCTIVLRRRR